MSLAAQPGGASASMARTSAVRSVLDAHHMAGTPLADPVAAPTLGQHTDHVLRDLLRYSESEIQSLTYSKAVTFPSP